MINHYRPKTRIMLDILHESSHVFYPTGSQLSKGFVQNKEQDLDFFATHSEELENWLKELGFIEINPLVNYQFTECAAQGLVRLLRFVPNTWTNTADYKHIDIQLLEDWSVMLKQALHRNLGYLPRWVFPNLYAAAHLVAPALAQKSAEALDAAVKAVKEVQSDPSLGYDIVETKSKEEEDDIKF